jgi:hypothetical protein
MRPEVLEYLLNVVRDLNKQRIAEMADEWCPPGFIDRNLFDQIIKELSDDDIAEYQDLSLREIIACKLLLSTFEVQVTVNTFICTAGLSEGQLHSGYSITEILMKIKEYFKISVSREEVASEAVNHNYVVANIGYDPVVTVESLARLISKKVTEQENKPLFKRLLDQLGWS